MAVALKGALEDTSIGEVVKRLVEDNATGLLLVLSDSQAKIYFKDGEITYAVSDEGIGEEVVPLLGHWLKGTFSFTPGEEIEDFNVAETTEVLLDELFSEISKWSVLKDAGVFPSSIFTVKERIEEEVTLNPLQWRVLMQLRSDRPLEEVAEVLGIEFFEIGRIVKDLLDMGLVEGGNGESGEEESIKEEDLEKLSGEFKRFIGPMGDIFLEEVVEQIKGGGDRIPKRHFPRLVDLLSQHIPEEDKREEFHKRAALIFSSAHDNEE